MDTRRHPFFETARPLVFAHRGGSALAPENTMAAFERGIALGADGLELDVHLSRDGVVVVHHDSRLDRTTNLQGFVADLTADELARADAGYAFRVAQDPDQRPFRGTGVGVPTLRDVVKRFREARLIIELKVDSDALANAIIEVLSREDAIDRVCLGSFGRRALRAARTIQPAIATSAAREEVRLALYRSWARWPVRRAAYQGFQVPETWGLTRVVSPRFVRDAHASGAAVQVWTVDRELDAQRLLEWKVDALITDRPDVVVPVAARFSGPARS